MTDERTSEQVWAEAKAEPGFTDRLEAAIEREDQYVPYPPNGDWKSVAEALAAALRAQGIDYSVVLVGGGQEPREAAGCRICGQADERGPMFIDHQPSCPFSMLARVDEARR